MPDLTLFLSPQHKHQVCTGPVLSAVCLLHISTLWSFARQTDSRQHRTGTQILAQDWIGQKSPGLDFNKSM